jgi:F0F1-type ATP synthase assembly protein I
MMQQAQEQAPWWQPGLILFYKLSGLVAGPILLAIFVGKYLDKAFNTEPWIFLSLTAVALVVSTTAIIYTYFREMKKIEQDEKDKKLKIKD